MNKLRIIWEARLDHKDVLVKIAEDMVISLRLTWERTQSERNKER